MTKVLFINPVFVRDTNNQFDYYGLKALDAIKESLWYPLPNPSEDDLEEITREFERENSGFRYSKVRAVTKWAGRSAG
jgi:hypothetical protein